MQQHVINSSVNPPLNGAFTIIGFSMRILMIRLRTNGTYELPGGGQEEGEELINTAVREAREEACVHIRPKRMLQIGDFIQRVPTDEGIKLGQLHLFQAQTFLFPTCGIGKPSEANYGIVRNIAKSGDETSKEADLIRFVPIQEVFDGKIDVGLGHKRLILHWLNYSEIIAPIPRNIIQGMLGDVVTANVPEIGTVSF